MTSQDRAEVAPHPAIPSTRSAPAQEGQPELGCAEAPDRGAPASSPAAEPAAPATDAAAPASSAEDLSVDTQVARQLRRFAAMSPQDPARAALREDLLRAHIPLVEHLARRFLGRGEPRDDLVQVGSIGLIKALDRYDAERGVPFVGYAVPTILGEIKRHFRDRGWALRVPRRLQEHGRIVSDARELLTQELGRAPTVAELAERSGLDMDDVLEALESAHAYATVPLEGVPEESDPGWLGVTDDALLEVENREALRPLLTRLPIRERRILALRFVRGMSQAQIAAEVGISQMHVSRLLARTLRELRDGLVEKG